MSYSSKSENPDERTARATELRKELVEILQSHGNIRSKAIRNAFLAIPRENFLPSSFELEQVYSDDAIVVKTDNKGMATSSSSQPGLMADMLEALDLQPGMRVLEIGAGVGYNAAIMAILVGDPALITSVDIDAEMVEVARRNLNSLGQTWERLNLIVGDGALGYSPNAPFDRIIVTVQQWEISPKWVSQLKIDGRLILPLSVSKYIWNSLIPSFVKNADGILYAVDGSTGGFMPMRGELQHPSVSLSGRDSVESKELIPIPSQLIDPTFFPNDKSQFFLRYHQKDGPLLLDASVSKFTFQPHGELLLNLPISPNVGRGNDAWARLSAEQRMAILQHQSFTTFLAIAAQDQLTNLLVQVELMDQQTNFNTNVPSGNAVLTKETTRTVLNPYSLALVEPLEDGSFDVALFMRWNFISGLRLVAEENIPVPSRHPNQALAKVDQIYRMWVQLGRLLVSQYRPISYPSELLPPLPGYVVARQNYNILFPTPLL